MEKISSIRKVLIVLFGHWWVVEFTYWQFFFFKFILRCKHYDIVPIICQLKFTAGFVYELPPVLLTQAVNLPPVLLTAVANLPPGSTTPAVPLANLLLVSLVRPNLPTV
jgi:hypothetical protein